VCWRYRLVGVSGLASEQDAEVGVRAGCGCSVYSVRMKSTATTTGACAQKEFLVRQLRFDFLFCDACS